jgi:hypothetical protein
LTLCGPRLRFTLGHGQQTCARRGEGLRKSPGFAAAAILTLGLGGAMSGSTFVVDPGNTERRIDADLRGVTPEYFQAMGIRLIAGRLFDVNDRASTEPVAIVDQAFAHSLQANGQEPSVDVQIVVDGVRHRTVYDVRTKRSIARTRSTGGAVG